MAKGLTDRGDPLLGQFAVDGHASIILTKPSGPILLTNFSKRYGAGGKQLVHILGQHVGFEIHRLTGGGTTKVGL